MCRVAIWMSGCSSMKPPAKGAAPGLTVSMTWKLLAGKLRSPTDTEIGSVRPTPTALLLVAVCIMWARAVMWAAAVLLWEGLTPAGSSTIMHNSVSLCRRSPKCPSLLSLWQSNSTLDPMLSKVTPIRADIDNTFPDIPHSTFINTHPFSFPPAPGVSPTPSHNAVLHDVVHAILVPLQAN
jgi:hypothetical protein